MHPQEFIDQIDDSQIVAAIGSAEKQSSGEIRVFVAHHEVKDVMAAAWQQFELLNMQKTLHRNGVLLYFVPRSRQFAVVGDSGVHEKCGDAFWSGVSSTLTERLKQGNFTAAIVSAVEKIGALLAQHFPPDPDNPNELPDGVVHG